MCAQRRAMRTALIIGIGTVRAGCAGRALASAGAAGSAVKTHSRRQYCFSEIYSGAPAGQVKCEDEPTP